MLSAKMQEALNKQLNAELYSSYLYLSMSAYFESINLRGFAHWMRVQSAEEYGHGMKFFDQVNERGGRVMVMPIEAPASGWNSPLAVFEEVYRHEQKVTELINGLVNLAGAERDHATINFLQWFVKEQVEEEQQANEIVQKLKLIGDAGPALLMLNYGLGKRGK